MSYKSFKIGYFIIWLIYWIFLFGEIATTPKQLNVMTCKNVYVGVAGAFGLIKHYYIKSYPNAPQVTPNSSDTDRVYGGMTLAWMLFPRGEINKQQTVTFYALKNNDNTITHFAATPGTEPASGFRLWIDIFAYQVNRFFFLHVGLFILYAFLSDIYGRLFNPNIDKTEIEAVNNSDIFHILQPLAFFLAILFIFI